MRSGMVLVAGMIVAAGAQAQQSKQAQQNTPTTQYLQQQLQAAKFALDYGECPGAFSARQQPTGCATVWTTALEDQKDNDTANAKPKGLGVHVDFQGIKTPVKALELRVIYEPLGLKRMPVAPGTNGFTGAAAERQKNFNLDREAAMRIDADLLVGPAATITRVHLTSAAFSDGSVWRAPSDDACSVVPSRVVFINKK